jgi:hypothetical protein
VLVTQASTLYQFKILLAEEKTFPVEQPYKDLMSLIKFILRQFFKALEKDRFLAVEVRVFSFLFFQTTSLFLGVFSRTHKGKLPWVP